MRVSALCVLMEGIFQAAGTRLTVELVLAMCRAVQGGRSWARLSAKAHVVGKVLSYHDCRLPNSEHLRFTLTREQLKVSHLFFKHFGFLFPPGQVARARLPYRPRLSLSLVARFCKHTSRVRRAHGLEIKGRHSAPWCSRCNLLDEQLRFAKKVSSKSIKMKSHKLR